MERHYIQLLQANRPIVSALEFYYFIQEQNTGQEKYVSFRKNFFLKLWQQMSMRCGQKL